MEDPMTDDRSGGGTTLSHRTRWDRWDKRDKNDLSHPFRGEPAFSADPVPRQVGQAGQNGGGVNPSPHLSRPSCPTVGPVAVPLVVREIDFVEPPPVGSVLLWKGQRFELAGSEPYVRRDGDESVLLSWSTYCAECAVPITVRSPLRASGVSRRCAACAAPGRPVGGRRRRNRSRGL